MPLSSKTTLSTAKASGYVAQLGKHFDHKIEVEQTSDGTVFHFSAGTARAQAQGDLLHLSAQADTAENLHKVETILGSHLERFAFREDLRVAWPENPSVK